MATYYIPVSGYYSNDKVFLVGPFRSKKDAEAWLEKISKDNRIDRYGPRHFDNIFILSPVSKTLAKRRFAGALREGRVIAETEPSFEGLRQAIELQVEYLDATR